MAWLGSPRGHTVANETHSLTREGYSPSNPHAEPPDGLSLRSHDSLGPARHAQAVCGFSCSASNRSPFFQIRSVTAEIFRARVSRAMAGCMPLANNPS
jgi:hypothetical protein